MAGERFGRWAESRILPKATKERSLYDNQIRALSRPGSKEYLQELSEVRGLVDSLFLTKIDRQAVISLAPTNPDLFKHFRRQALLSDHNIPHLTTVAALSALDITRRLEGQDASAEDKQKAQKRAWIIGMLHDIRRGGDVGASIPPFLFVHGASAASKAPELMEELHVDKDIVQSQADLAVIRRAVKNHDYDRTKKQPVLTELEVIKTTDRAAIGRLFESRHVLVRATAGILAAKRMRAYPPAAREQITQEYMDGVIRIAGAVDILTRQKIRALQTKGHLTAESAYQATLDVLQDLGVFALQTTGVKSAA